MLSLQQLQLRFHLALETRLLLAQLALSFNGVTA
jgi:hypothetical protein